jgi:hypothetical protein
MIVIRRVRRPVPASESCKDTYTINENIKAHITNTKNLVEFKNVN